MKDLKLYLEGILDIDDPDLDDFVDNIYIINIVRKGINELFNDKGQNDNIFKSKDDHFISARSEYVSTTDDFKSYKFYPDSVNKNKFKLQGDPTKINNEFIQNVTHAFKELKKFGYKQKSNTQRLSGHIADDNAQSVIEIYYSINNKSRMSILFFMDNGKPDFYIMTLGYEFKNILKNQ